MARSEAGADAAVRMERMYRWQRSLYDLTRKYYLVGRDRLIEDLDLQPGESLLDIGCGTARNLERIANRYPDCELLGFDASTTMLDVGRQKLARSGLGGRVHLAFGLAGNGDELAIVARTAPVDRIVFSYSLSMFDDPAGAVASALKAVRPGGKLHIVDFGMMRRVPGPLRAALRAWLKSFHVHPSEAPKKVLEAAVERGEGRLQATDLMGGYASLLSFAKTG